jgi:tetratricopeptide (TPR) repeat protein
MRAKTKVAIFSLTCCGLSASAANAQHDFMGHCTNDAAVPAGNVISACTEFISHAFQENWQLEYVPAAMVYEAGAYERLEKYNKAELVLKAAVTRYHDYSPAWEALGKLLEKLNGPGLLMATMDLMIQKNPGNAEVLNEACWIRAKKGEQLDAAVTDCSESLQLKPGAANTLDSRALANFRKGNFSQAIADANSALAIDPKMPSSLYVRGLAKLKSGNAAEGSTDIAAAKSIDAKIADTYAGYGVAP